MRADPELERPLDADSIRGQIQPGTVGRRILVYDSVPSTNTVLRELARTGAEEGTVVLADSQTAGRGREGRPWISPPGVNLHLSVLLRPSLRPQAAPLFTFIASLALTDAIEDLGVRSAIKWPNDVLVDGKKVAGVLAEMSGDGSRLEYLILGVGVNLNVDHATLAGALGGSARGATSLREVTGDVIDRNAFAAAFCNELNRWLLTYREPDGVATVLRAWRDRDILTDARVEVREAAQTFEGRVQGVDDEGYLLVQDSLGKRHRVLAGEIRLIQ